MVLPQRSTALLDQSFNTMNRDDNKRRQSEQEGSTQRNREGGDESTGDAM